MSLAEQLARFHAIVTGAAPLESAHGLVEAGPLTGVDASARLGVYVHAYAARIADVLVLDYPKLAALVSLRERVAPYLRAYPPAHPSLRDVGQRLARFLAERGEPAHLVELARLERARTEAFDGGADAKPLTRADLAAVDAGAFPALRLQLVPSSRLVELTMNADAIWDAIEAEHQPPTPVPCTRTVLVWRRDVTVVHRTLDDDEAPLVRALSAGTTFGDACALLGNRPSPAERALEFLLRWLEAGVLVWSR